MTAYKNRAGYQTTPRSGESDSSGKPRTTKWKNSPKKKSTEAKRATRALQDKKQELRLQEVAELDFYGE